MLNRNNLMVVETTMATTFISGQGFPIGKIKGDSYDIEKVSARTNRFAY